VTFIKRVGTALFATFALRRVLAHSRRMGDTVYLNACTAGRFTWPRPRRVQTSIPVFSNALVATISPMNGRAFMFCLIGNL
jgi:hypothetical protein